jgi:hypothetical protein
MLPSVLAAHAWGQLSVIFELEQDNLGDWHTTQETKKWVKNY